MAQPQWNMIIYCAHWFCGVFGPEGFAASCSKENFRPHCAHQQGKMQTNIVLGAPFLRFWVAGGAAGAPGVEEPKVKGVRAETYVCPRSAPAGNILVCHLVFSPPPRYPKGGLSALPNTPNTTAHCCPTMCGVVALCLRPVLLVRTGCPGCPIFWPARAVPKTPTQRVLLPLKIAI